MTKNKKMDDELFYEEAMNQGCDIHFLRAFEKQIVCYPLEQTRIFLDTSKNKYINKEKRKENVKQWKIWLKILIDKNKNIPNHDKRIQSLDLLK